RNVPGRRRKGSREASRKRPLRPPRVSSPSWSVASRSTRPFTPRTEREGGGDSMSQTAKRFNLIDQEYIDFIQSLMSKTVTEPIAGLRASATEALAAPAGELMLAKEDLVRAAQNLDRKLTANLTRAVDTLESVSDELSGVGSRLDELVQERNDRRQLVQQISVALEKLHLEISAGTETLTQARKLANRLSELQAGLEDRWPTFERSIYERWKTR